MKHARALATAAMPRSEESASVMFQVRWPAGMHGVESNYDFWVYLHVFRNFSGTVDG